GRTRTRQTLTTPLRAKGVSMRKYFARVALPLNPLNLNKGVVVGLVWMGLGLYGPVGYAGACNSVTAWERLSTFVGGHTAEVWSGGWAAEGMRLASGSADRAVRVWAADDGRLLRTLTGHTSAVFSVAWSPDGTQLASGSYDQTVRVWAAKDGRLL